MAVKLRRLNTAGEVEKFDLEPTSRYGFGVSWDAVPGKPKVDIDLQCVVVDTAGSIIDCAYYNNLKAVRSITHSGDETTGARAGIDEEIWVTSPRVPQNVALLIFVLAANKGGTLRDVVNGKFSVFKDREDNMIATTPMERSEGCVDIVASMQRTPTGWSMRLIDMPAEEGQHFMDILDTLGKVIREYIPSAPKRQKVAFAMEKGGIMDLPQTMDGIVVGLGWDTGEGEVDLDVSAVMLDASGTEVDTVFFGRLEAPEHGIKHTGDNLTGEGAGDDEQICVNLSKVGPNVHQVAFCINIYTKNTTFQQVSNPYCRVVESSSGSELCRYSLSDAGRESALVVSKISRENGGRWGFHALGLPCIGRTWKDSLPYIKKMCTQDTRLLMQRGGTMSSGFDNAPFATATAAAPQVVQAVPVQAVPVQAEAIPDLMPSPTNADKCAPCAVM